MRRARPGDRFRVVGFTHEDVLAGGVFGVMGVSAIALRKSDELYQLFGALALAARRGSVVQEKGEVYFLSPLDAGDPTYMAKGFRDQYPFVFFFNDSAFRICAENHIVLPPTILETTRARLPQGLGVAMRSLNYVRVI
jgi:hypothetical protein